MPPKRFFFQTHIGVHVSFFFKSFQHIPGKKIFQKHYSSQLNIFECPSTSPQKKKNPPNTCIVAIQNFNLSARSLQKMSFQNRFQDTIYVYEEHRKKRKKDREGRRGGGLYTLPSHLDPEELPQKEETTRR
ncbi:unnamed protein product [Periconia digitata]|uniref:Uncharacterized protein n=1 Tax=Periconia digitata TaxID=1303443 RepID=A0A9W4U2Z3_9PLEO|nr:unnamed protein product [Periconia digitata]